MVNPEAMTGTGQLPKFEEDLFRVSDGKYYLIPTAEVPVTNIHRDEILDGGSFPSSTRPIRLLQERGRLLRPGHARPHPPAPVQQGGARQVQPPRDELRGTREPHPRRRESIETAGVALPRRHALRGDLGFAAAKTYDIEVWVPSQNTYREISCPAAISRTSRPAARTSATAPVGRQAVVFTHLERLGSRGWADARGGSGEFPARRRLRRDTRSPAPLHGRNRRHRALKPAQLPANPRICR